MGYFVCRFGDMIVTHLSVLHKFVRRKEILQRSCTVPEFKYCYLLLCSYRHNKDTVIIRAINDIKAGEELTISYYPITQKMPFQLRQWHCQKYHFVCSCDLCLAGDVEVVSVAYLFGVMYYFL